MNFLRALLCGALVVLAGCDTRENGSNPGAAAAVVPGAAQRGFLRILPDACEYLTEALARDLLKLDVTRGPSAGRMPGQDGCTYAGPGGSGKSVGFGMILWSVDIFDSNTEPRDKLAEKASFLANGLTPDATLENLGNIAFVFRKGDSTSLMILTGIGGTAVLSDRIVSELSINYQLSDPDQAHEARLGHLVTLARRHLAELAALAAAAY